MDRDRLHDRIRRLLFASPALAKAFASGDYRSVFRGRGIEFDSLRDYGTDDDARLLDWSATARLGKPFVRTYREDRSLTVFLLIDASASMDQGSGELSKLEMAVLSSSLAAYAAQFRGLPVGCLVFARTVLRKLSPRRGKAHALAVAEAALAEAVVATAAVADDRVGSDLALALRTAQAALKRRSLVLVVSDFRARDWSVALAELARKHDVVAVRISDRSDTELPPRGAFPVIDPESEQTAWLPLGSRAFARRWAERGRELREMTLAACAEARVSVLEIDTADDPARRLLEFFEKRSVS
ncbi:MAG: DUF58 domain-containing protein [Spirochaetaceae bacterium]|nr:DUF58 domain-containing protein [Spirochaetaceae bacterium]